MVCLLTVFATATGCIIFKFGVKLVYLFLYGGPGCACIYKF
jgi:hypothetical protein